MAKAKKKAPKKVVKKAVKAAKPKAAKKVKAPVAEKPAKVNPEAEEKQPLAKKERSSILKRDRTKYELNGNGEKLGKGKFALAVVKQFMTDKPKTTFDDLGKTFPVELQKGYGGIFQKVADVKKNELTARYFMDAEQTMKTGDGVAIAIVREFGAGNIGGMLEVAKKLGYKVKEHKGE